MTQTDAFTVPPTPTASSTPLTPPAGGPHAPRRLLRRRPRVVAGVAAGLAEYSGLPPALVRVLFVVAAFMGWGLFAYPILWLLIPDER